MIELHDARETGTAESWAEQVNWQAAKTVDAIVAVGRVLIAAKARLPHGEFLRMFTDGLIAMPPTTARRLMAIARHAVLANGAHLLVLPRNWTVLYELSKLPNETLRFAIAEGLVSPAMSKKQVLELRPAPPPAQESVASVAVAVPRARTKADRAARLDHIRQLAHDGYSPAQIGAAVGLHASTVPVLMREHGIECPAARTIDRAQRRIDSNRFVEQVATETENLTAHLDLIDFHALDRSRLGDWIASLNAAKSALRGLIRQLEQERDRHAVAQESGREIESQASAHPRDASPARARGPAEIQ